MAEAPSRKGGYRSSLAVADRPRADSDALCILVTGRSNEAKLALISSITVQADLSPPSTATVTKYEANVHGTAVTFHLTPDLDVLGRKDKRIKALCDAIDLNLYCVDIDESRSSMKEHTGREDEYAKLLTELFGNKGFWLKTIVVMRFADEVRSIQKMGFEWKKSFLHCLHSAGVHMRVVQQIPVVPGCRLGDHSVMVTDTGDWVRKLWMVCLEKRARVEHLRKDERKVLKLFVIGNRGSGKSSLINRMMGKPVAKEAEDIMENGTFTIQRYVHPHREVELWDVPGLEGDAVKDHECIIDMKDMGCANADTVLYCINMSSIRLQQDDRESIKNLTKELGNEFWKNTVFVLTFSNREIDRLSRYSKDGVPMRDKFVENVTSWRKSLADALKEAGVDQSTAEHITVLPVGYENEKLFDEDKKKWIERLWHVCMKKSREKVREPTRAISVTQHSGGSHRKRSQKIYLTQPPVEKARDSYDYTASRDDELTVDKNTGIDGWLKSVQKPHGLKVKMVKVKRKMTEKRLRDPEADIVPKLMTDLKDLGDVDEESISEHQLMTVLKDLGDLSILEPQLMTEYSKLQQQTQAPPRQRSASPPQSQSPLLPSPASWQTLPGQYYAQQPPPVPQPQPAEEPRGLKVRMVKAKRKMTEKRLRDPEVDIVPKSMTALKDLDDESIPEHQHMTVLKDLGDLSMPQLMTEYSKLQQQTQAPPRQRSASPPQSQSLPPRSQTPPLQSQSPLIPSPVSWQPLPGQYYAQQPPPVPQPQPAEGFYNQSYASLGAPPQPYGAQPPQAYRHPPLHGYAQSPPRGYYPPQPGQPPYGQPPLQDYYGYLPQGQGYRRPPQ